MKKQVQFVLLSLLMTGILNAQNFTEIFPGFDDVYFTITCWGDVDNDGDLDLFLAGEDAGTNVESNLYMNLGNDNFELDTDFVCPPLEIGAAEWADIDGNGFVDLVVEGYNGLTTLGYTEVLYNNGDGTFTEGSSGLPQTYMGDISCVDFNNDSHMDIAISGFINEDPWYISKLFRNDGEGGFIEMTQPVLPGTMYGTFQWADYNNDGYSDFVLTGFENDYVSNLYKNNGDGTFSISPLNLHQGWLGDVAWADYNNDGFVDLTISGTGGDGTERFTLIYKNNGDESFTELPLNLPGVSHSSLEWADFDNDNDLDLFICGTMTTPGEGNYISTIFLNDSNDLFTENTNLNLPVAYWGDATAADFNNDGAVDLLITGLGANEEIFTSVFRNDVISGMPVSEADKINIYPNPSQGKIYLGNVTTACSYQVFDIKGRTVSKGKTARRTKIDLSAIKPGLYIINLEVNGNIFRNKLILE